MDEIDPAVTGRASTDEGPLLPARRVLERYSVVDRTLDRWLANPKLDFPRPLIVNSRRYFRMRELEAWERSRAAQQTAAVA